MLCSTLRILIAKYCAILDSSQSNNASWRSMKDILQTKIYYEEQVSESVLTKLASLMLEAK